MASNSQKSNFAEIEYDDNGECEADVGAEFEGPHDAS